MIRSLRNLADIPVLVHLSVALFVGVPVIILGIFVSWRIQVTKAVIDQVHAQMIRQNETSAVLIGQQQQLINGQEEGLTKLRKLVPDGR